MKGRIHRIVGATGAVLAGVALLASGVQAAERPDDRSGMLGVGGVAMPVAEEPSGVFERAVARHVAATLPDPFARVAVRPDDRPGLRVPGMAATSAPASVAVESGGGFAWSDAALGAAVTSAFLLALGAFAAVTIRHRGRALAR